MITGISAGTATITATYSLPGQTVQTMLSVSVSKQVRDVSPATLSFGTQNVGTSSASQSLTVTNAGAAPLKILSLTAGGDFLETDNCASSSPLAAGGTCTINVTFTPGAAGARSGKLTVANGFSIIPSSIGLSGTGIGQPTTATVVTSSANPSVFRPIRHLDRNRKLVRWHAHRLRDFYRRVDHTWVSAPRERTGYSRLFIVLDRAALHHRLLWRRWHLPGKLRLAHPIRESRLHHDYG
jgi:Abnormal spindle-like microcephaly-assoc'd, ASPM-SPD-2-Hydin